MTFPAATINNETPATVNNVNNETPATPVRPATTQAEQPRAEDFSPATRGSHYCAACNVYFASRTQSKVHKRTVHQMVVKVIGRDVPRGPDSLFHCDCGRYSNANPENFRNHWNICQVLPDADMTETVEDDGDDDDDMPEEVDDEMVLPEDLDRFRLAYHEGCGLLECLECHKPLWRNVAAHMSKEHDVQIPRVFARSIVREYVRVDSPYLFPENEVVLPRVPFMPAIQGFACNDCRFKTKIQRVMTDHILSEDHIGMRPTWFHNFGQGAVTRYVEVEPPAPIEGQGDEADIIQATIAAGRPDIEPFEPVRPDPFLEAVHVKNIDDMDRCAALSVYSDRGEAAEEDAMSTLLLHAEGVFIEMMNILKATEYAMCALFGVENPLTYPQCAETVKEYRYCWKEFLRFAVAFCRRSRTPIPAEIVDEASSLLASPSRAKLVKFIKLMTEQSATDGTEQMVFEAFLRSRYFRARRLFIGANGVSRLANKLVYLQKLAALVSVRTEPNHDVRELEVDSIKRIFTLTSTNAFSVLSLRMSLAQQVARSEFSPPQIVPIEENPHEVEMDGVRITLQEVRDFYSKVWRKVEELQSRLCFGGTTRIRAEDVDPRMTSVRPNCGLMCRDSAKQKKWGEQLLVTVLADRTLKQHYVHGVVGGRIRFNPAAVNEYLALYDEYIKHLLVLIHMGSGMPARGTELERYSIANDAHHPRVLQFTAGHIVFISSYNKTNAIRQANQVVARSLCWEQSLIVLRDVFVVRPFLTALLAGELNGNRLDRVVVYRQRMFALNGSMMDGQKICEVFHRVFTRLSGKSIHFGAYRHLVKYFVNLHALDEGLFHLMDANVSQFGHRMSVGIAAYGIASDESELLRTRSLLCFMRLSKIWHQFLSGMVPESFLTAAMRMVPDPQHPTATVTVTTNATTAAQRPRAVGNPIRPVDLVGALPEDDLSEADDTDSDEDAENVGPVDNIELVPRRPFPQVTRPDMVSPFVVSNVLLPSAASNPTVIPQHTVGKSLELLRRMLNVPDATFKNFEQRAAVEAVLYTDKDVVAVMATGGGKSLLFFLYAMAYQDRHSVVVVPTIALREDLMARGSQFGIRCADTISTATSASLLFITPESMDNVAIHRHIADSVTARRFGRLFVDEAHLILSEGIFRPMFRQVSTLRRYQVPLVLMTATLTPARTSQLSEVFYIDNANCTIVRSLSNRTNHRYQVRTYESIDTVVAEMRGEIDRARTADRFIIYRKTIAEVDLMHASLQRTFVAFKHHSNHPGSSGDMQEWRTTDKALMIATSGFGSGIDYRAVRAVFCIDVPYSLADMIQQFGRAGRDGRTANCVLYVNRGVADFQSRETDPVKKAEYELARGYAEAGICRRRYMSDYLDGIQVGCEYSTHNIKCDTCERPLPPTPINFGAVADTRVSLLTTTAAYADLREYERAAWDIRGRLERLKGKCIVCSLMNKRPVTLGSDVCRGAGTVCRDRCMRCFATDHAVDRCRVPALREKERPKHVCCWCLMPYCVMAIKTHPSAISDACPYNDIIKNTVMAAGALRLPVVSQHTSASLYHLIHKRVGTMGVHGWLVGHILFLGVCEEIFKDEYV